MTQLLALSTAIGVSLALSTIIAAVITEPLRGVLRQLCLDSNASAFWIPFTTVMFYVTPLLFTMLFEGPVAAPDLVNIVRTALASSLFGAFAALLVVGYQISRAAPCRARLKHMTAATLFPSVLGSEFAALDPCLRSVHSGDPRRLTGSVTVEHGMSFMARVLGAVASLPSAMTDAPIEVRIGVVGQAEKWTRLFGNGDRMTSTLQRDGNLLVEKLGPAALSFRLSACGGAMKWALERITVLGIALPVGWFCITVTIDVRDGRYHFVVDSALRWVGRIVHYEGLLDAAA